jgi:hypothetical protein
MDIDELSGKMESCLGIFDHDGREEYIKLYYSQEITMGELRHDRNLLLTKDRYMRYLQNIDFSSDSYDHLNVIGILIGDFLSFQNWESNIDSEIIVQAAKCKTIDFLILEYMNSPIYNNNNDNDMESVGSM